MEEKTNPINGLALIDKTPRASRRLSWRLASLFLLWIVLLTASVSYTFLLNKRVSDYYVSLSYVSTIRSDIYKANIMTDGRFARVEFKELTDSVGATIRNLRLSLEASETDDKAELLKLAGDIRDHWHTILSRMLTVAREQSSPISVPYIESIMPELTDLETRIQRERDTYATLAHATQILLVILCVLGFFVILYCLVRWVIRPIDTLSETIEEFTRGNFSVRLSLKGSYEFEHIGDGFNRMAARLQSLVQGLETITQQKTFAVEERNRNLAQLYEITSSLARIKTVPEMCDDFTLRLIHYTGAYASAVFLLDEKTQQLKLAAQTDLPQAALDAILSRELFYTDAENFSLTEVGLKFFPSGNKDPLFDKLFVPVQEFKSAYCFHVRSGGKTLGLYLLFYGKDIHLSSRRNQLYENFGTHLAVAIANRRLVNRDREFAVAQERTFLAQGLHDSIAQSLSFLNLQVQILEGALKDKDTALVDETVGQIKTGVQESYEDVRELLLNFRERLHREPFAEAVTSVVDRFRAQTGIPVDFRIHGTGEDPTEQQKLQIVFIMQEALANVRKHAMATAVTVLVNNEADFEMAVIDNGQGIDRALAESRKDSHFGLSIMRERAERVSATVTVESAPATLYPHGTAVRLKISAEARGGHHV